MSLLLIVAAIAGSLIAGLPAFLVFLYIARLKASMWVSAILGGIFWFVALLARIPILLVFELVGLVISPAFLMAYTAALLLGASLMAGLFEEGIKYVFLKKYPQYIKAMKHALCFGLGWGISEALLLYVFDVLAYGFLYDWLITIIPLPPESILILNFMIGAIERNIAILFHVSATIIVALAIWHRRFIFAIMAILAHFLFDFIPLMILQFVLYPTLTSFVAVIIVEGLFGAFAIFLIFLAFYLWKREGGPSEPQPETEVT